ncbi:hypothetical protein [Defluviimonas sp. SAOS-178_SWC]|uniref:hypothetical protein n=1 Tax=Defluviimonas sp. SAOS-178_SWC TaxID=3121287 RepID=UPI003221BD20
MIPLRSVPASLLVLVPVAALAQPKNHLAEPLAQIFIANGCEMAEQAAADALVADGWFASDFQVQAVALGNDGYLVATPGGRLKLVNWGSCK